MASWISSMMNAALERHTAWRRARNLRAGRRRGMHIHSGRRLPAVPWAAAAAVLAALAGGVLIAGHARHLGASAAPMHTGPQGVSLDVFQAALPGAAFTVPAEAGVSIAASGAGALVIAAGMRAEAPVRVDLCSQVLDPSRPRLLPLRIGYRFDDVRRWVARNETASGAVSLRNIALAGPTAAGMPQIEISGMAGAPQLRWESRDPQVRWIGDAAAGRIVQGAQGQAALGRQGWLAWGGNAALRFQRRASAACPQAGELLLQLYKPGADGQARALVSAFPAHGQPVASWLAPGQYQVPELALPDLEDQLLFDALQARGLVRLGAGGLIELAPPDLAAWLAAPAAARAAELAAWRDVQLDAATLKLLKRLYRMADGDYVRDQVRIFNGERRLLAWRVKPGAPGAWQASVGSVPASTSAQMPAGAARLFADVPQGWAPWTRIADWPQAGGGASAQLTLALPQAAQGGETMQLMLVGRVLDVQGASLRGPAVGVCSGRACPSIDAAQAVTLELRPGARTVSLSAAPVDMSAIASGDAAYRHLQLVDGKLAWRPLAASSAIAHAAVPADAIVADRNGTVLWSGGAPTQDALDAGLAPLLGVRADHANSVAGMLARLPSASGMPHEARLTLDLPLQAASQGALACIGMRRGHWDGARCSGGAAAPAGRRAGIVIIDTENGDVLAAAGAGAGAVNAANWEEVRDFDRANPARSPLRLPALQHDGGAHNSPGSTFKVISALGLELAARRDPQLEALLDGMPLPEINQLARHKGFAFQTNAASYPFNTRLAHITNYKDQQLDRRAQGGRLGLPQALTYSLNTWFAWSGELSDLSLFGRAEGGAPDLQPLEAGALDGVRPIVAMARRLGFEQALRLDGGLLPPDYAWAPYDALQASAAHIDPIHSRHELRQMAIGLRMQVTPLQMALVAGAVGQGRVVAPRLLLSLDGRDATAGEGPPVGVRLDRIRAGMKGVVDVGTGAGAFKGARLDGVRRGLSGKTGTSPSTGDLATVWFTGWLEPGSIPGQTRRLAVAAFVSHSEATGGQHAAPIVAAVLASMAGQNPEQKGK